MEPTANPLDGTSEYLCGICTDRLPSNSLIKHLTEHIEIPGRKHTHFLWCKLCSPLLRQADEHVNVQPSDPLEYTSNGGSGETNFAPRNYSRIRLGTRYFHSRMTEVSDCTMLSTSGEYLVPTHYTWHQEDFYNGTYIYSPIYETVYNGLILQNSFNYWDTALYSNNPIADSCSYLTTNVGVLLSPNYEFLHENAMYIEPCPETANEEMLCSGNVTYIESFPETTNDVILYAGHVTYVEPCHEATNAEISGVEDATYVELQSEVINDEIPRVVDVTYLEPQPEATDADILCVEALYVESNQPENALNKSHLSESPYAPVSVNTSNSNHCRTDKNSTILADTLNSDSRQDCQKGSNHKGSRSDISRRNSQNGSGYASSGNASRGQGGSHYGSEKTNKRRNGQSGKGHKGSRNVSCQRDKNVNDCKGASSANCHEHESDEKTRENSQISGDSSEESRRNFSYSAAVKRSL